MKATTLLEELDDLKPRDYLPPHTKHKNCKCGICNKIEQVKEIVWRQLWDKK